MPIKLTEFDKYQQQLRQYFEVGDLQFKVGATNRDKTKGMALAYINSSAVMDRLDEVIGAENWTKQHDWGERGEIMCGISILFEYPDGSLEWHTKWDAGVQPDFEPEKGGISDSLKRAANCWGIGRYLRKLPSQWLPIEKKGKGYYFKQQPTIPKNFLPEGSSNTKKKLNNQQQSTNNSQPTSRKQEILQLIGESRNLKLAIKDYINDVGKGAISELNKTEYKTLVNKLKSMKGA